MRTSVMFLRFLFVGGSGFLIDAGVTYLLVTLSLPPWLARIPAIATAMLYTWMANRYFTYSVKTKPSRREATAYFLVAASMSFFNYALYLALLACRLSPVAAVAIATACQSVLSFFGYQRLVFGKQK